MKFDVLLPTVVFFVAVASVFLYQKFEKKITGLFEEKKFSVRDAVLMVAGMGVMVTVMALVPSQAIQILFIAAYSYMLFSLTYIALRRWYLAFFPPVAFLLCYFLYWELPVFNTFVAIFAVIVTVYLAALFSWKTVWIFAVLLTVMDVIQVFGTGYMGEYAIKTIELKLPVLLKLPTYPAGGMIGLGLGDVFLAGLLSVQTALKKGRRAGIHAAAMIGIAMFVFEIALLNIEFAYFFPATVVVVAGWFASMGFARLIYLERQASQGRPEESNEQRS